MSDLTPETLAELRRGAEQCAAVTAFPHDGIGLLVRAIPALADAAELLATVRDQVTRGALCPMCSTGATRWTVGLVCQLCDTDYSRPEYATTPNPKETPMSDLTPETLAELRRLAEACPMPDNDPRVLSEWYEIENLTGRNYPIPPIDAAFIVAASPDVVLGLLDRLVHYGGEACDNASAEVDRLTATVERVRKLADRIDRQTEVETDEAMFREAALTVVLPDLLADAWDEGYTRGFYDREQLSPDMPGRDASEGATPNPYRTEGDCHE